MAKYVYPAIFTPEESGLIAVRFPDVSGCYTSGENLLDAIEMAQDALALMLSGFENDCHPIPPATPVKQLEADANSFITLIVCNTDGYSMTDEQSVSTEKAR